MGSTAHRARITASEHWDRLAIRRIVDDLFVGQRALTAKVLSQYEHEPVDRTRVEGINAAKRYVTLHPGDIVWFGCDAATLPPLQPGDLVEVVNAAIGVLANRVRKYSGMPR